MMPVKPIANVKANLAFSVAAVTTSGIFPVNMATMMDMIIIASQITLSIKGIPPG
jgi:hypothetical protein